MKTLHTIVSQWPDYQPEALRVPDAIALLSRIAQAFALPEHATEQIELPHALGRVLAQNLVSPGDVPPHDNAAMDGYAFPGQILESIGADTQQLQLQVVGTLLAGQVWTKPLQDGECLKIMTGAAMPSGVDTVVPHEWVRFSKEPTHCISLNPQQVKRADHCRLKGEDLRQGSVALPGGCILTPAALGLAASLGLAQLTVMRRLRVAYFSTGNEILNAGEATRAGAIFDSNRYSLTGMLGQLGCSVVDGGAVPDDPARLQCAFERAAACADVVITTGGVSTGDADLTHALVGRGGEVLYWKLAMRPGRPMAVGRMGEALLLGLPGNPVAAMVSFLMLVQPALQRMMGATATSLPKLQARSLESIRKKPGRTEFVRGILRNHADGTLQVQTTGQQGSGMLSSMVQAHVLIVLAHEQGDVAAGDLVEVQLLHCAS